MNNKMIHVNDKTVHVNNKIIIEFGFRGISRIIEASVSVIYNANLCLNNSRYPAQPHPIIINYLMLCIFTSIQVTFNALPLLRSEACIWVGDPARHFLCFFSLLASLPDFSTKKNYVDIEYSSLLSYARSPTIMDNCLKTTSFRWLISYFGLLE